MRQTIVAFFVLALAEAGVAQAAKAPNHCGAGEKVGFSCPFKNGKVVSLCVDGAKQVSYRFGKPGAIELTYPAKATPKKWFSAETNAGVGIGAMTMFYFSFRNGEFEYSITSSFNRMTSESEQRLGVSRKGKSIATFNCVGEAEEAWGLVDPALEE